MGRRPTDGEGRSDRRRGTDLLGTPGPELWVLDAAQRRFGFTPLEQILEGGGIARLERPEAHPLVETVGFREELGEIPHVGPEESQEELGVRAAHGDDEAVGPDRVVERDPAGGWDRRAVATLVEELSHRGERGRGGRSRGGGRLKR